MGGLRLQLPDPGVEGDRAKVVVVLKKGYQIKSAFHMYKLKFRTACSAAVPKLGDYIQWVRLRAPMKEARRSK